MLKLSSTYQQAFFTGLVGMHLTDDISIANKNHGLNDYIQYLVQIHKIIYMFVLITIKKIEKFKKGMNMDLK